MSGGINWGAEALGLVQGLSKGAQSAPAQSAPSAGDSAQSNISNGPNIFNIYDAPDFSGKPKSFTGNMWADFGVFFLVGVLIKFAVSKVKK